MTPVLYLLIAASALATASLRHPQTPIWGNRSALSEEDLIRYRGAGGKTGSECADAHHVDVGATRFVALSCGGETLHVVRHDRLADTLSKISVYSGSAAQIQALVCLLGTARTVPAAREEAEYVILQYSSSHNAGSSEKAHSIAVLRCEDYVRHHAMRLVLNERICADDYRKANQPTRRCPYVYVRHDTTSRCAPGIRYHVSIGLFSFKQDGGMDLNVLVRRHESPRREESRSSLGKVVETRLIPFIHSGSKHFVRRDDLAKDITKEISELQILLDCEVLPAARFGR